VLVSWAQHHDGPWFAVTTSLHNLCRHDGGASLPAPRHLAVGAGSVVVTVELHDANPGITRRIDGMLVPTTS
jgi:hypothetical protein